MTVISDTEDADIGCTFDFVLVVLVVSYYLWDMSTVLDSPIRVVWQRQREM